MESTTAARTVVEVTDLVKVYSGGRAAEPVRAVDHVSFTLSLAEPTLDDVFLAYCGTRIREEAADQPIELGWY